MLLPPEEIMDQAIAINATFSDRSIELGKKSTYPHISLYMGVLDVQNLDLLTTKIEQAAHDYLSLPLTIDGIVSTIRSNGKAGSVWNIRSNPPLQSLHETIIKESSPFLSSKVKEEMVASKEVNPGTLEWISAYAIESSSERFEPHITLGLGQAEPLRKPITFTASRIAICHLGNYCTCQRILWEETV